MQFTTFLAFTMISLVISAIALRADELYPTRPRAIGTGLGGAWLRLGSSRVRIFVGWVVAGFRHPICLRRVCLCGFGRRSGNALDRVRPTPITDIRLHLTCQLVSCRRLTWRQFVVNKPSTDYVLNKRLWNALSH